MTARIHERRAVLVSEMTFPYPDPVTGKTVRTEIQKDHDRLRRLHAAEDGL